MDNSHSPPGLSARTELLFGTYSPEEAALVEVWYTGKLHISIRSRQLDSRASRFWVITSASHSVSCKQYNISVVVHISQNYHSVSSKNMCVLVHIIQNKHNVSTQNILVQWIELALPQSSCHVLTCRSSEYLQKSKPEFFHRTLVRDRSSMWYWCVV